MRTSHRASYLVGASMAALLAASAARADGGTYSVRSQPIPGATPAGVAMDYIAFDPATGSVWIPAGGTGQVVVVDSSSGALRQISGLPTAEMGSGDRKRIVGPSSVTIGGGVAYVGNRADSSVCAFDARSLAKKNCHTLDSMPDGLAFVGPKKEVWVTTPRDQSIRILDAQSLDEKAKLKFDGAPEGFAVDSPHSRFYTNLEDKDLTLAIDLESRKTVDTWKPECGEDGPHGLRVDAGSRQLFIACSAKVEVMSTTGGKILSSIETGDGVDDIDYSEKAHLLYAGAARAGQLTVASVDAQGKLAVAAKVATPQGARNPAVTDKGVVYLTRSKAGEMVIATPSK